jgi:hypothetical protein
MDNKITELSYSVYSNKGAFALLLGSGVSRPAGVPTGWEIAVDLIRQIAILEKQKPPENPETWFQEYFKEPLDYSNILEKLTKTSEERINLLRQYFEPNIENSEDLKTPTIAHQQIAHLVQSGYIKVIVTTNFDRLIENSIKDLGIEPVVISNPGHVENTIPLIHSKITVIKINGDYLDTKFLNIKSELSEYDPRIANLLTFIFENFGIVTCGWSAKWDTALVNILKASNKFRYSNYFLYTNNYSEDIEILNNHRRGSLVKIKNADNLFNELTENIHALENNYIENPLSSKIALNRVKKYLAKDEHLIPLSEIVHTITEDTHKKLNSISFPYPTENSIKEVIDKQFNYLEQIIPILVEGGYWSKDYQLKVWSNSIKRIGSPIETTGNSYAIWNQLPYLPLTIARYAFGIASLAAENWSALKTSFEIKFNTKYDREYQNIINITHVYRVIDNNILKSVLGKRYHTPMSELLFMELRKHFNHFVPDDKDFEDIFDYYEYTCCLFYLNKQKNEDYYPPIGRFGWRDSRVMNSKIQEFSNQGDEFELIKSGLFTKNELTTLIAKMNEKLKSTRFY